MIRNNIVKVNGEEVYLSNMEYDTLLQIEKFMLENQVPPTVRDLCKLCGVSSPSTVHSRIKRMVEVGVIRKSKDISRGISSARLRYVSVGG